MGLDMYLTKRKYIWSDERAKLKVTGLTKKVDGKKVKEIVFEAGYWRKANAIHQWFVNNVQNGEDDCKEYYVSVEQLQELLQLCRQVLKIAKTKKGKIQNGSRATKAGWEPIMEEGFTVTNPEDLAELLPTSSGFFFGSTDYDQYYLDDIKETVKIIDEALADDMNGDFYYRSSW